MLLNVLPYQKRSSEVTCYEHAIADGLITVLTELSDEGITHQRYLQLLTALESLLLLMQYDIDLFIERVRKTCPNLEGRLALQRFAKVVVSRLKAFNEKE